jgi:hypothetical protein
MLRHSRGSPIKRCKRGTFGIRGRLDRTQEVAGSSPASSTSRTLRKPLARRGFGDDDSSWSATAASSAAVSACGLVRRLNRKLGFLGPGERRAAPREVRQRRGSCAATRWLRGFAHLSKGCRARPTRGSTVSSRRLRGRLVRRCVGCGLFVSCLAVQIPILCLVGGLRGREPFISRAGHPCDPCCQLAQVVE